MNCYKLTYTYYSQSTVLHVVAATAAEALAGREARQDSYAFTSLEWVGPGAVGPRALTPEEQAAEKIEAVLRG